MCASGLWRLPARQTPAFAAGSGAIGSVPISPPCVPAHEGSMPLPTRLSLAITLAPSALPSPRPRSSRFSLRSRPFPCTHTCTHTHTPPPPRRPRPSALHPGHAVHVADRQARGQQAEHQEWLRARLVLDIVGDRVGEEVLELRGWPVGGEGSIVRESATRGALGSPRTGGETNRNEAREWPGRGSPGWG
jgi:hypothetical protein